MFFFFSFPKYQQFNTTISLNIIKSSTELLHCRTQLLTVLSYRCRSICIFLLFRDCFVFYFSFFFCLKINSINYVMIWKDFEITWSSSTNLERIYRSMGENTVQNSVHHSLQIFVIWHFIFCQRDSNNFSSSDSSTFPEIIFGGRFISDKNQNFRKIMQVFILNIKNYWNK